MSRKAGRLSRRDGSGAARSFIIVAYDISDDRRRTRVAGILLSYGARIQGSVYELWLDERQLERMWAAIGKQVAPVDLVRCYIVCAACEARVRSYGMEPPEDDVAFIV
jgi:CRISPR-associated protein Cas2